MLGRTLRNHYQIIKFLGKGAFGHTYLAKDLDLPGHPQCVVKHLKPQNAYPDLLLIAKRLFDTEAQTLDKLGKLHDQIPTLFDHFEEKGEFYLVQDFIAGHDLTEELILGKKLSESYAIKLLYEILEVLAIVHQQNVIHRDLKPANLMRRQDGKIILIDFGAVKEIRTIVMNAQGQTKLTIAIGTPGYMPSEQASGKPRLASDIHAVGMIGIEALTGQPPHTLPEDPQTGEVIWRNRAQVSNNLANVLDKMVRDHFSQRYQNAGEALQALSSLLPNASRNQNQVNPVASPRNSSLPIPLPVVSPNTRRRTLLQLGGFAGAGFVIAVVTQNFGNKWSPYSPENSSPKLSPENPPPQASSISLKTFNFETVTVNSTGKINNHRQGEAKFFTDNLGNGVTIDMIAIPGGNFVMGSPNTEAGRFKSDGPQHNVTVGPFFMGKYEVTQKQWDAVMGNNRFYFNGGKRPAENVSWYDAVEFCQKLSQKTGKNYRLPSEAEWEYACRAGTSTPFYFGETITPDLVNYSGDSPYGSAPKGLNRKQTTDVGSFPPNAFGLYDMHGNVSEWCADPWHDSYEGAPQNGRVWDEKDNDNSYQNGHLLVNIKNDKRTRLLRGGSWFHVAVTCRAAARYFSMPEFRSYSGFRVVCTAAWTS
ncbi:MULTISPECIES: bifunctional serine/threonine-protein kinase/formylglycine-generating enzyme family protein [unclassified Microcoleus]|uniref:bifunctional serine/threonine-protein kinase/formylglycine-generating enzyme family protein n=1 Tax=unclassified Microcoleus TaxID=2642155 RepID=UPI002FD592E5